MMYDKMPCKCCVIRCLAPVNNKYVSQTNIGLSVLCMGMAWGDGHDLFWRITFPTAVKSLDLFKKCYRYKMTINV